MEVLTRDLYCFECSLQFDKRNVFGFHLSVVHGEKLDIKLEENSQNLVWLEVVKEIGRNIVKLKCENQELKRRIDKLENEKAPTNHQEGVISNFNLINKDSDPRSEDGDPINEESEKVRRRKCNQERVFICNKCDTSVSWLAPIEGAGSIPNALVPNSPVYPQHGMKKCQIRLFRLNLSKRKVVDNHDCKKIFMPKNTLHENSGTLSTKVDSSISKDLGMPESS